MTANLFIFNVQYKIRDFTFLGKEDNMQIWSEGLCVVLLFFVIILLGKLILVYHGIEELRLQISERLKADTNVGIVCSFTDRRIRHLAADLDWQLELLRKERQHYIQGDRELKNAVINISHDLRTPLTAICGYMDLLSKEKASNTIKRYLSIIENRISFLKQLTEELFSYSIIVSENSYQETEEIVLNSIIEECIAGYYGALKEAGIEPRIDMPKKNIVRIGNKQAMARILSNIVSNAIKYSEGDFYILLEETGTMYFQNKSDKLDRVQVEHLFDRFYTVESGCHATGLGLSIARTLVEEMNGTITAEYKKGCLCIMVKL